MEEVKRRDAGVTAEFVKIGAASMDDPPRYDVIIDRISHEVPYYRTYLKQAVVQGVVVVIIACTIVGAYLWGLDQIFRPLVDRVLL